MSGANDSQGPSTNEILGALPDGSVQLTVRLLDSDTVLIEGERESLLALSDLLRAHARGDDCGWKVGPSGAGSSLFSPDATHGIYVHRLPCDDGH